MSAGRWSAGHVGLGAHRSASSCLRAVGRLATSASVLTGRPRRVCGPLVGWLRRPRCSPVGLVVSAGRWSAGYVGLGAHRSASSCLRAVGRLATSAAVLTGRPRRVCGPLVGWLRRPRCSPVGLVVSAGRWSAGYVGLGAHRSASSCLRAVGRLATSASVLTGRPRRVCGPLVGWLRRPRCSPVGLVVSAGRWSAGYVGLGAHRSASSCLRAVGRLATSASVLTGRPRRVCGPLVGWLRRPRCSPVGLVVSAGRWSAGYVGLGAHRSASSCLRAVGRLATSASVLTGRPRRVCGPLVGWLRRPRCSPVGLVVSAGRWSAGYVGLGAHRSASSCLRAVGRLATSASVLTGPRAPRRRRRRRPGRRS